MVRRKRQRLIEPWFRAKPETLEALCTDLRKQYPTLHALIENEHVVIRGSMPIIHGGIELDRYQLEVLLPDNYPRGPIRAWETGRRIPKLRDRHVNPEDGTLCVGLPEEIWPTKNRSLDVLKFLNGPVRLFLNGNSLVERGHEWPHGEWDHGAGGICQFYGEKIRTEDKGPVHKLLTYLAKPRIKGHWNCPCGSGLQLRNCHFDVLLTLRDELPSEAISYSLEQVTKAIERDKALNMASTRS